MESPELFNDFFIQSIEKLEAGLYQKRDRPQKPCILVALLITDKQTNTQINGQTDRRYQTYYLPCFAVDKYHYRPLALIMNTP